MTCRAVLRSVLLAMTGQAGSHVVPDVQLGSDGLGHVAVTGGARDTSLVVRGVTELHVGQRVEPVDANPGNLNIFVRVGDYLLNFGAFGGEFGMTKHAFLDRRNACGGTGICSDVAIDAIEPKLDVSAMRKRDRLLRQTRGGIQQN
jgi:hypothetical protein